ncbi:hypothetical protein BD413DRAFT_23053 [Trametes elegans]|nr:hypothetical protein BD413DRAFT_23053 [Trametes elegans]
MQPAVPAFRSSGRTQYPRHRLCLEMKMEKAKPHTPWTGVNAHAGVESDKVSVEVASRRHPERARLNERDTQPRQRGMTNSESGPTLYHPQCSSVGLPEPAQAGGEQPGVGSATVTVLVQNKLVITRTRMVGDPVAHGCTASGNSSCEAVTPSNRF